MGEVKMSFFRYVLAIIISVLFKLAKMQVVAYKENAYTACD